MADNDYWKKKYADYHSRSESRIAELKALVSQRDASVTAQAEIILELKAENDRLKEEFKRLKESECKICKYSNIGDKYYQTLQEIEEIAETCISKDACFECKYSDDCYIEDAEIPTYDICKLLINLITKAESEG